MGFGDDLMLTAQARMVKKSLGVPALVKYWSEVFEGNPDISATSGFFLDNYPGHRPYHLGAVATPAGRKFIFNPNFRARPGHLHGIKPVEIGEVVIEPNYKPEIFGANKDWGWENYQDVVNSMRLHVVQVGPVGTKILDNVQHVVTPTFRNACEVLAGAKLYVGSEGGLHHAAAALGIPAVVIFGGHTPPWLTGYEGHINLVGPDPGCGNMYPCDHCRRAMDAIKVDMVVSSMKLLMGAKNRITL